MYDVVVVGGGPAGCYAASILGKKGFDVHVFEEHAVIGEPVDCSGVVGTEAFATLGIPESVKLGVIDKLTLVSPSQLEVRFRPPSPLAYIVDRAGFDKAIADWTMASGASVHFATRATDLRLLRDCVEVRLQSRVNRQKSIDSEQGQKTLTLTNHGLWREDGGIDDLPVKDAEPSISVKARVVILADGPRYRFQNKLGMGQPRDFLKTAQTEVAVSGLKETKVFIGSTIAPQSFAWVVPFKRGEREFARIGVSAKTAPVPYLKGLLRKLHYDGHLDLRDARIRSWVIPITPLKRTYAERVLAVGDAAGQTKPTTGGGIYYGLICAEAAGQAAAFALEKGDFSAAALRSYERTWRGRLGREIKTGRFFRRLVERLKDDEIDDLFRIVQSDGILTAVTEKARFDWHRDVICYSLRHLGLGRIFLRGLFR